VFVPVAPEKEQVVIASWIDEHTVELAAAVDRASREMALLRELRARLIVDAVTGRLDVRQTAAQLKDEAVDLDGLDELEDMPEDEGAADDEELEAVDAA
jgi:type I restriction enzyme, S subunit